MRNPKKVGRELLRALQACLDAEMELQAGHAADDYERAWRAAVRLKRSAAASRRLFDEFAAAMP